MYIHFDTRNLDIAGRRDWRDTTFTPDLRPYGDAQRAESGQHDRQYGGTAKGVLKGDSLAHGGKNRAPLPKGNWKSKRECVRRVS
jgi:hypothetical protein